MSKRLLQFAPRPQPPVETHREEQAIDKTAVLAELYLLLEDYAPVWYTQEHHDRALRALLQRDT